MRTQLQAVQPVHVTIKPTVSQPPYTATPHVACNKYLTAIVRRLQATLAVTAAQAVGRARIQPAGVGARQLSNFSCPALTIQLSPPAAAALQDAAAAAAGSHLKITSGAAVVTSSL
jgi:hypothetical protein